MGGVAAAMPAPVASSGLRALRHEVVSYTQVLKKISESKVTVVHAGEDVKQVDFTF